MTYTLRPERKPCRWQRHPYWLMLSMGMAGTGCLLSPLPSVPQNMPYCEPDRDGDGFAPEVEQCYDAGQSAIVEPPAAPDCDNFDAATYPGATEYQDGRDNDCDSIVDNNTAAYDDDGDGYSEYLGDCNDANSEIHPDAEELDPNIDANCDGQNISYLPATPVPAEDADVNQALALYYQDSPPPGFLGYSQVVGDLDGDGFAELALSNGSLNSGSIVYVYYGSEGGPRGVEGFSDAPLKIKGIGQPDSFGIRLLGGDLNCDGNTDLLIGDWFQRRISVFFGGSRRTGELDASQADITFRPVEEGAFPIGASLAVPGDMDGDGCEDLLLGQPDYGLGAGRVLLFYGRTQFDRITHIEQADASFVGEDELVFAGAQVHGLRDLNGDGLADFGINVPWYETYQDDYILGGKFAIYYGRSERHVGVQSLENADASILPDTSTIAYMDIFDLDTGDLDADGYPELVLGMPAYGYEGYGAFGLAAIIYGSEVPFEGNVYLGQLPYTWLTPKSYCDVFGESVTVGDVTGDGIDDAIVLSPTNVEGVPSEEYLRPGYVAVFEGRQSRPLQRWAGEEEGALILGSYGSFEHLYPVDSFDLTGDGISELIVGSQYFVYADPSSAVYVFEGGALP